MASQEYVLGTDDAELARLGLQHQLWNAVTSRAWERAGFGPGQSLLDVGCGPGFASFDLSRLVGPHGRVVGIDRSERFLSHLQEQARARGISNLSTQVSDVEAIKVKAGSFDGAYARWVLCFVRHPETVIAGVRRALKTGAPLVIHDYYNYEGVVIAPRREIFGKIFAAVSKSWRMNGGNSDVGSILPELLVLNGFEIREIRPIVRVARPGSPLWAWPTSFFANYLTPLVQMKLITARDKSRFETEWQKHSSNPAAFFSTPPLIEIIAVRKK